MNKYEKILDKFISIERKKTQMGSGDDGFYEQQIEDYVNEKRKFWITFIKFLEQKITKDIFTDKELMLDLCNCDRFQDVHLEGCDYMKNKIRFGVKG